MAGAAGSQIVRPGLRHRYAFLRHRGAIDVRNGRKVAKELVRPIYQYRDLSNLFVWLRKAAGDRRRSSVASTVPQAGATR